MATLDRDRTAERHDVVADLSERQRRAAEAATTVGEFRQNWKEEMHDLLGTEHAGSDGASAMGDLPEEAKERDKEIDRAAGKNGDIRLETLGATTKGQNTVGGGRGGMVLNRSEAAALGDTVTADDMQTTVDHEAAHGRSVQLTGVLYDETGQAVDPLLMHEGFAEVESMGEKRRPDQPPEVYGEGQTLMLRAIQKVGRDKVQKTMTVDGDVTRLQPAFSRN